MSATPGTAQESRTERVAITVTPSEKRAVRAVAAIRGTNESDLCRENTITEIVAEFERVRAASADGAA